METVDAVQCRAAARRPAVPASQSVVSQRHAGKRQPYRGKAGFFAPAHFHPFFLLLTCLIMTTYARGSADSLSLAGSWRLQLDRADVGVDQRWFARPLEDVVELPGSLPGQGIGDPITVDKIGRAHV